MDTGVSYSKAGLVSVPSVVTSPEKGGAPPVRAGRLVSDVLSNTLRKANTAVLHHTLLVASVQQKCPRQIKMIEQIEK